MMRFPAPQRRFFLRVPLENHLAEAMTLRSPASISGCLLQEDNELAGHLLQGRVIVADSITVKGLSTGPPNHPQGDPVQTFELQDREYIELNNLLKVTGLCASGGIAKLLIADGLVTVDGQVELRKRCKIRQGQVVEFEGEKISVVQTIE